MRKNHKWSWDDGGTIGYNHLGAFEITLMKMGLLDYHFDFESSESYDMKYNKNYNEQISQVNNFLLNYHD